MPRKSRQPGSKHGPFGTRKASTKRQAAQEDSDSDGILRVGGVTMRIANGVVQEAGRCKTLRSQERGRRAAAPQRRPSFDGQYSADTSSSSDEDDSESEPDSDVDLQDYLENLEIEADQDHAILKQFSSGTIGQIQVGLPGDSPDSSATSSSSSSSVEFDLDSDEAGVLTAADLDRMSLRQRYPVRAKAIPTHADPAALQRRQAALRGGKGGPKGGKVVRGEKERLRKKGIKAKRAARSAVRGFNVFQVNREMYDFVQQDGDIKAFDPMDKLALRQVQRMAAIYGLRNSVQGTGKKRFVVVASCERTAVPTGAALDALKAVLEGQVEAERDGAKMGAGIGKAGMARGLQTGPERWTELARLHNKAQRSGEGRSRRWNDANGHASAPGRLSVPIAFVSRGVIQDTTEVVIETPVAIADSMDVDSGAGQLASHHVVVRSISYTPDTQQTAGLGQPVPRSSPGAGFNPARQLGLGMALGIGARVFEDEGAAGDSSDNELVDLSPLQGVVGRQAQHPSVRKGDKKAQRKAERRAAAASSSGGMSTGTLFGAGVDARFGNFERHTTGVGSRIMAQWGFKGPGGGLGKDERGISEPVQARMRPKLRGLGADH